MDNIRQKRRLTDFDFCTLQYCINYQGGKNNLTDNIWEILDYLCLACIRTAFYRFSRTRCRTGFYKKLSTKRIHLENKINLLYSVCVYVCIPIYVCLYVYVSLYACVCVCKSVNAIQWCDWTFNTRYIM